MRKGKGTDSILQTKKSKRADNDLYHPHCYTLLRQDSTCHIQRYVFALSVYSY